jgi:hypothetical protein
MSYVVGATVAAVGAIVFLVVGTRDIYRSITLESRGAIVHAQVLAVRYGSRADEVQVRLPAPINRDVELVAWSGHPRVGDVIGVRYDRDNSGLAEQEGSWPWQGILFAFVGALWFAFGSWWLASTNWRQRRRRSRQR